MAGSKSKRGGQGGGGGIGPFQPQQLGSGGLKGDFTPGYTNNDNPQLLKWQSQEPDKAARFLGRIHNKMDVNDYQDKHPFYDFDGQKFTLALNLNDKPTIMKDADFEQMVRDNNLQVLYRGDSGQEAVDRMMNDTYYHPGTGYYGDGLYFSEEESTANSYAWAKGGTDGRYTKFTLSPNAHVISYSDLTAKMNAYYGTSFYNALHRAGQTSYMGNEGEAMFALRLGYNVIEIHRGKHVALTRDALVMSDKVYHARRYY